MPLWLAPEQVRVLPISQKTNDYANMVGGKLADAQLRFRVDLSDEKIGAKIAKAHGEKIPYMLVVGPKEAGSGTVNVRMRGVKENKTVDVDVFTNVAKDKNVDKMVDLTF